jgi:hypothetical protein
MFASFRCVIHSSDKIYGLHNGNLLDYRNCIIGKNYAVKISDHAMYCGRHEADYYVSDTKARLPIRWMAWESLLLVSIVHQCCTLMEYYFLLPKYVVTKHTALLVTAVFRANFYIKY